MFSTGLARWQDAETRQAGQIHVETLVMSPRGQGCLLAESSTLPPNGPFIRGPGGPPSFPNQLSLGRGAEKNIIRPKSNSARHEQTFTPLSSFLPDPERLSGPWSGHLQSRSCWRFMLHPNVLDDAAHLNTTRRT